MAQAKLKRKKRKKSAAAVAPAEKPVAPVIQLVPRPEPATRISYEAVGQVRAAARNSPPPLYTTTDRFNPDVFRPARPPRGVVPDDVQPMAMDEDLGSMWGAGSGIYSENLQWLGMPFLAELSQRAEYRQIVETLAKEMTRKWIRVIANGDGDFTKKIGVIESKLKKHKIREKFRRLAELDGFFGRGHLYVDTGVTDDRDLLKTALVLDRKLNKEGFLRGFRVVEPSWSYPGSYNARDPLAEDFYRPHTWYVFGKEVHRSRFLTFVSRELPDLLKPSYSFGGMSMSQLAKPYVDNWLRTRQSVSDLVHAFSVSGIKTDMSTIMTGGGAEQLMLRAELFSQSRDNLGTMVIDKDREEFFNVSTPLGTLDRLQAQAQEQMASVSHEPLIVLLGITPSGLNASSDGELQVWASYIKAMQEHLFDDPLRFVIEAIQLSEFGEIDPAIDFDYEPLRELTEAEEATARKTDADTDKVYVDAAVLSPDEIRLKIAADPDSPYSGIDLSAPAPEPSPDTDPLDGPPDGSPGGAPGGGGDGSGRGSEAPTDALGAVAAAIAARREDTAYQNWWDQGHDAEFKEADHPRSDDGKFGSGGGGVSKPDSYQTPENARDNHGPLKEEGKIEGVSKLSALSKDDRKQINKWQKTATASLKQGDEFNALFDKLPVYSGKIYRGLKLNQKTVDSLKPGSVYTADGNASGTSKPTTAATFAETPYGGLNPAGRKKTLTGDIPVVFEVDGSGPYVGASTSEVVLRKGVKYEITEHEKVSQTQRYLAGGDYNNPIWKDHPPVDVLVIRMKESGQAHDEDSKPVERRQYGSLQIGIETRKGEIRRGDGWECVMPADYGYIMRTTGADGDRVDVFVGPYDPEPLPAFIVEQHHLNGDADEHKVMIGFQTIDQALLICDQSFSDGSGPDRRGEVHQVLFGDLRAWLKDPPARMPPDEGGDQAA